MGNGVTGWPLACSPGRHSPVHRREHRDRVHGRLHAPAFGFLTQTWSGQTRVTLCCTLGDIAWSPLPFTPQAEKAREEETERNRGVFLATVLQGVDADDGEAGARGIRRAADKVCVCV